MLKILIMICVMFIVYEIALDRFYKQDLKEEKLISFFSNTRMLLMKMLYMKEVSKDSCYFNFMIRATSYSIRTIYYKKKSFSLGQLDYLREMCQYLNTDTLKNEFNALNEEQKELFAKTALKIVDLYFNTDLSRKIYWKLYLLQISSNILKFILKIIENILKKLHEHKNDELSYINEIENSYSLSRYAFT